MRLDEIASAEPVYLKIKGQYAQAGVRAGKYRVKSMTQLENGFDVGVTSWADGTMFVPDRTNKDLMFVSKSGQPITPARAYSILTGN